MLRFTFFVVIGLLLVGKVAAQTQYDLVLGGDPVDLEILVHNSTVSSVSNPTIKVNLATGVEFVAGSLNPISGLSNGATLTFSSGGTNELYLKLNGAFPANSIMKIQFKRYASCNATPGAAVDLATVDLGSGNTIQGVCQYTIWEPMLIPQSIVSSATPNIIAGQDVDFTAKIKNTGQHSYVSKFSVNIVHDDYETPKNIILEIGGVSYVVQPADTTIVGSKTIIEITPAIIVALGKLNGKIAYQDELIVKYRAVPKLKCSGGGTPAQVDMKVTTKHCGKPEVGGAVSQLNVYSPGYILTSFDLERVNFDFPDALNNGTVNGSWAWDGGMATPVMNSLRNGDMLKLDISGLIRTSSLLSDINYLYSVIEFSDGKQDEFIWNPWVTVQVKKDGSAIWSDHTIMALSLDNTIPNSVRYKLKVPDGLNLSTNDQVRLIVTAVMKYQNVSHGFSAVTVDVFATKENNPANRYPNDICKALDTKQINRIAIYDTFIIPINNIKGTCTPVTSTAMFKSAATSTTSCTNCFTDEFRSNHYVKEVLVFVPNEGTISNGTITIGSTLYTFTSATLPVPTTTTFTDGVKTYSNAKCYTFDLESIYGTYGASPLFEDEQDHNVIASFNVVFSNPINTTAQTSAILYEVKPANPSIPTATLVPMSAIQKVSLPSIFAQVQVANPPGRAVEISPLSGEVVWRFTVNNPSSSAYDLDNLSLKIEHLTGGSFSNVTITQMRPSLPNETFTGENVTLKPIPSGATHTIEIKGIVNEACNTVERINALLIHKPCGGSEITLATEELAFKAPASAVQVSSTLASTNLTMCDDFEVTMVISALKGTVNSPMAKLVLPKNGDGYVGVTFLGVRKDGALVDFPYSGSLEELTFDLNAIAGVTQLTAGQEVILKVRLEPNCNFAVDSKLTSFAYGKNFCSSYNSEGSGIPVYTDVLTINGLQSAYKAQVIFSNTALKFDKSDEHKKKSTKLTLTKVSGGNVGNGDLVSVTMPLLFKVSGVQLSGVPVTFAVDSTSTPGLRKVTWPLSNALSTAPVSYDIVFELNSSAKHTDNLNGKFDVVVINKVEGLPCGFTPCPSIEAKAGEGSIAYNILDLFPGLAKDVSYKANSLMDYTFTYTFTLKNFSANVIENVRLSDDLAEFYSKGSVSAISATSSSPLLHVNSAYNGTDDIQLLASNSRLLGNEIKTVTLSFNIIFNEDWRNKSFTISNTALVVGNNENGTEYEDKSNNGIDPDLTDETPTTTDPIDTNPPEVTIEPVIVVPPPGFAITANGVECFEGNVGTQTPLEFEFKLKNGKPLDYKLCFTVYTRDSVAMVRDSDYLKLNPKVICIEAGDIRSSETVVITLVGDDKYEQDEPFVLQVKQATEPITCKSPVITILNDDPIPNVIIDNITLEGSKGAIVNTSDYSKLEGTSTTERTKFNYCVTLNVPAPQALELRVTAGNDSDSAKPNNDYYFTNDIVIPIAAGVDKVCFDIEVEPDATPENDEVFTLSFSLEVSGTSFLEEVRRTTILNDDEFIVPSLLNSAIVFCQNDDAIAKATKLQNFVDAVMPTGYQPRWYKNQTSAIQVTPDITSTVQGAKETFYLGYYNPVEDYESPIGKRSEIDLTIQSEPQWGITSNPTSPMKLIPGQSVLVTVEPNSLQSYSYALNGAALPVGTATSNEMRIARSKFTSPSNVVDVEIIDAAGCSWSGALSLEVELVELPNAFIPEGNNTENKTFLKGYDIRIFNRWGHLLYKGLDGWDGRYRGSYVAPGTYYYVLNLRQEDGSIVEEKGHVMVVNADKK